MEATVTSVVFVVYFRWEYIYDRCMSHTHCISPCAEHGTQTHPKGKNVHSKEITQRGDACGSSRERGGKRW